MDFSLDPKGLPKMAPSTIQCLSIPLDIFTENCEAKLTLPEVLQHYQKCVNEEETEDSLDTYDLFKVHTMNLNEHCLSGEDCYMEPTKFEFNNQTFLLLEKTDKNVVYKWVYLVGTPEDAKQFLYALELVGPKAKVTFEGKVAAVEETFEDLYQAGKCLAIPHKAFVAQLVNEDSSYEYSLEIWKDGVGNGSVHAENVLDIATADTIEPDSVKEDIDGIKEKIEGDIKEDEIDLTIKGESKILQTKCTLKTLFEIAFLHCFRNRKCFRTRGSI